MKRIAWIAALSTLLLIPAACSKPTPPQPGPRAKPAPPVSNPAPAPAVTKPSPDVPSTLKPDAAAPDVAPAPKKPKATASSPTHDSPFGEPDREVKRPADKAAPEAKPKGLLDAMGKALLKGITNEEKQPPR